MPVKELKIKVPNELVELLGSKEEAEKEITQSAVIEWFREGRISSGKAAELLGMSLNEFIDMLGKKRIPIVTGRVKDQKELEKLV